MYKVVVIDDEPKVRRGLSRLIPELDAEWTVVGEAKNGIEGLELVGALAPDLVITDIRMPHMNGLDLLGMLRDHSAYVVILSGYGYFEYAQTAVKFGAYDYLLKPLKPADIADVLQRVKQEKQRAAKTAGEAVAVEDLSKLWKGWLLEGEADADGVERLRERMDLSAADFRLLTVEIDLMDDLVTEDQWGDRQLVLFAVRNVIADAAHQAGEGITLRYMFVYGAQLYYLITCDGNVVSAVSSVMEEVRRWIKISVSAGISRSKQQFAEIPSAYSESREAIQNKWIFGHGSVSLFTEFREMDELSSGYPSGLEEELAIAVGSAQLDKALLLFDQFLERMRTPQITFRIFRRFCLQLTSRIIRVLYEQKIYDLVLKHDMKPFDLVEQQASLNEFADRMKELLRSAIETLSWSRSQRNNHTMDKALQFIHSHYTRDVALDEVAQHVQMNASYFSTFFKQEMGTTFIDYISRLRMDKAKELMADEKLRLYEIAGMVGYQDVKYFSRLFKRNIGVTPADYRDFFVRKGEA